MTAATTPQDAVTYAKGYLAENGYVTEARDHNRERWSKDRVQFEVGYASGSVHMRWRIVEENIKWQSVSVPFPIGLAEKVRTVVYHVEMQAAREELNP